MVSTVLSILTTLVWDCFWLTSLNKATAALKLAFRLTAHKSSSAENISILKHLEAVRWGKDHLFVMVSNTPRGTGRLMFLLAWLPLMVPRLGDHGQWSWSVLTGFVYINEAFDREPIAILENCFWDQNGCEFVKATIKSVNNMFECCLETVSIETVSVWNLRITLFEIQRARWP